MSLEELLHDYYANLLYLKWQHPKYLPTHSTENEASRQLSQTPRHGSMSYDKCVVLIQTIPGCKNFGTEETRCRRGKAKWRVLGKELGAWLQFPAFAITCVLSTRLW